MATQITIRAGRQRLAGVRQINPALANYTFLMRSQMRGIENQIKQLIKDVIEKSPDIVREAFQPTFDLSQKYVPVDTGELKASGVFTVTRRGERTRMEMSYGKGGRPPYTVFVHEIPYKHKSPTRHKFLQGAIEEDIGNAQKRLIEGYTPKVV